jgi:hypothetical protein
LDPDLLSYYKAIHDVDKDKWQELPLKKFANSRPKGLGLKFPCPMP